MGITLANFQLRAIAALNDAMELPGRDIVLKSCTGSGKTIMLTSFMAGYLQRPLAHGVRLAHPRPRRPGGAELREDAPLRARLQRQAAADVMSSGFEENDVCFINWEKLNKKGNNALKDSEHANFIELVRSAASRACPSR